MSRSRQETTPSSSVVGQYQLIREIGSGGMAIVYLAQQLNLQREVALKELRLGDPGDASFARRFLREARLAGSFSHPNIVTVHDYFEHGGVPYIAMEFLPAGSLRPYVGDLTLPQAGGVLTDALAGLGHAEQHGVVHRDIKPENLLVTAEGGTKITDFGVAKVTSALASQSMVTGTGNTVGTPNYLSPEQAMGRPVGPWTDIYSLGITAFELLVGHPPFGDTDEPMAIMLRHVNEVVPRVSDQRPTVHPWVSDWVAWLTAKAPEDRPRSALQARQALDDVLVHLLGPRWGEGARLPTTAGAGDTGPTTGSRWSLPVAGVPLAAASPPMADPIVPLAATQAPARPVARTAAAGSRSGGAGLRRLSTLVKVGVGLLALVVGVAVGVRSQQPSTSRTPVDASDPVTSLPSPAPALPSASPPAPVEGSTAGGEPEVASTDAWLGRQGRSARRLARDRSDEATRLAARPANPTRLAEIGRLRREAGLYRSAAAAASRGDVAAYAAALTAARGAHVRNDSPQLPASPTPSPSARRPTSPTTSAPHEPSCAGDSTSDDPSDDECGGEGD